MHAHEAPMWMLVPLAVLGIGSFAAGFPFKELFAGHQRRRVLPRDR